MNEPQKIVAAELAAQGFSAAEIAEVMALDEAAVAAYLATLPAGHRPETGPLRAINFVDRHEHRRAAVPGSIWIAPCGEGEETSLWFICPCGCGAASRITVGHRHKPRTHAPSWEWNGSHTEPTLHPSVNQQGCGWHGWLRDGYWERC